LTVNGRKYIGYLDSCKGEMHMYVLPSPVGIEDDEFNGYGPNIGCRSDYSGFDPNDERCAVFIPADMKMYV
jgi:hypothetical protein